MPRILIIAGGIFACVGLAHEAMPARGTVLRLEPRRGNNAATYASGEHVSMLYDPARRERAVIGDLWGRLGALLIGEDMRRFQSEPIWIDPTEELQGRKLTVFVEAGGSKRHFMHLSAYIDATERA